MDQVNKQYIYELFPYLVIISLFGHYFLILSLFPYFVIISLFGQVNMIHSVNYSLIWSLFPYFVIISLFCQVNMIHSEFEAYSKRRRMNGPLVMDQYHFNKLMNK